MDLIAFSTRLSPLCLQKLESIQQLENEVKNLRIECSDLKMALSRAENDIREAKAALDEKEKAAARAVEAAKAVKSDIPTNAKSKKKGWGFAEN